MWLQIELQCNLCLFSQVFQWWLMLANNFFPVHCPKDLFCFSRAPWQETWRYLKSLINARYFTSLLFLRHEKKNYWAKVKNKYFPFAIHYRCQTAINIEMVSCRCNLALLCNAHSVPITLLKMGCLANK